jgi:hypothetical protein
LGQFIEHLAGSPNPKGLRKPFQVSPTPCKKFTQPTPNQWGTIQEWNCAQKLQKKKKKRRKIEDFGEMGFRVYLGKNGKWGAMVASGG